MYNYKFLIHCLLSAVLVSLSGCEKKSNLPELTISATYDGSRFSSYAAQEIALVNNLNELITVVRSGNGGEEVNVRDIALAFSTNSPNVKSATTPYFTSLLEGTGGLFDRLSTASAQTYTPSASPGGTGGVYGGYVFDANGLEPAELIGKGLLGAALYGYALNLFIQNPNINNPATVDRLLATYGATPDFPNSPNAPRPDKAVAAYVAQFDKNDGKGLYSKIKQDFLKLQAAYSAGEAYTQARDQAYSDILSTWEKGLAAAAIHSCHRVVEIMSTPTPSDAAKAQALHRYSECIGLLLGLRTIPNKTLTDASLDELLGLLNFQPQGSSAAYKIVTDPAREIGRVREVLSKLKSTYGFSDQEIEDLKKDWVSTQSR